MTADSRFERDLPEILEDLYLGPTPDYRTEALAAAVRTRQRPSWAFAGRWLPMADIASRPAFAPRVPLRSIGVALLIIALVVAAAALAIGSRKTSVPPPFGLARNGLLAYAAGGDIYLLDPTTDTSRAIVTGPEIDTEPVFSPDGTHLAFRRAADATAGVPETSWSSRPTDRIRPSSPPPQSRAGQRLEWAPNSQSILATQQEDKAIWLFDATAAEPARTIATNAYAFDRPFQPPDGSAFLMGRDTDVGRQVFVVDIATGQQTRLVDQRRRWRTCSAWCAGHRTGPGRVQRLAAPRRKLRNGCLSITRMAPRQPGHRRAPGAWYDIDAASSSDGERIAFIRYEKRRHGMARPPDRRSTRWRPARSPTGPCPGERAPRHPNPSRSKFRPQWGGLGHRVVADGQSVVTVGARRPGTPS